MKAGLIFTGSGPIVVLTSFASFLEAGFVEKLREKGLRRFLAYELPMERVESVYGAHYEAVQKDVKQSDELRVVDLDGHHAFYSFSLNRLGDPVYYEEEHATAG